MKLLFVLFVFVEFQMLILVQAFKSCELRNFYLVFIDVNIKLEAIEKIFDERV